MTVSNAMTFRLKDRTRVEVRPVYPGDRDRLLNGFRRISKETNINRFHTFKKRFTDDELDYLLSIDQVNHLAIGAIDCNGDHDVGIGLARYVRTREDPEQAEVAIIVIDEYQGKGLGRLLYRGLMKAAARNGIKRLLNIVRKDNKAMIHLLYMMGAQKINEHDEVYEFSVTLTNTKQQLNLTLTPRSTEKYYCRLFPDRCNNSSKSGNSFHIETVKIRK